MKVYMHLAKGEVSSEDATIVINGPGVDRLSVQELLKVFWDIVKKKVKLEDKSCEPNLTLYKGLSRTALPEGSMVCSRVHDGDELYVKAEISEYEASNVAGGQTQDKKASGSIKELLMTARGYLDEGLSNKALPLYRKALKQKPTNPTALSRLVEVYVRANRPDRAVRYAQKLHESHPDKLDYALKLADVYCQLSDGDKALQLLLGYTKMLKDEGTATKADKHKLQVGLCKAYQAKGQRDMAVVVVQGVLREDRTNFEALMEFATLSYGLSELQSEEAMVIALTSVATHKDNKLYKKKLGELCAKPGSMPYFQKAAHEAWKSASSVAYLATILRDHGAAKEAVTLMEHALDLEPSHRNIFLTYIHLLEIFNRHTDVVKKARKFLDEQSGPMFRDLEIAPVIRCLPQDLADVYLYGGTAERAETLPASGRSLVFAEFELDFLAILFTLVKVLYIKGALGLIPPIIELLEPLHNNQNLHKTHIRNEAAYFSCIQRIHQNKIWPEQPRKDQKFVYFVADSHCVPPAWRTLHYKGTPHVLHPVLSTGTKIWHIRPESTFYPKVNFENSLKVIPDGATVIFCFGEIDCRESILRCVELCKYDSLEEGIDCVISIYMKVLVELQENNNWIIYVHPVPSVLDVTRPVVMHFNKRLAANLKKEPSLRFLNINDKLVDQNKSTLLSEYEFDGTHLHPDYIRLMEEEMRK